MKGPTQTRAPHSWTGGEKKGNEKNFERSSVHPCATFWADESLVLVFHHVVLSKRMGHESSSFWTLFHVVGVLCPFPACLLPVGATLRGVTFRNQSVLGCLRVGMGIRAVRVRDAFGFCLFHGRCDMLLQFLLMCSM